MEGWEIGLGGVLIYSPSRLPVQLEILLPGETVPRTFRLVQVQ